MPLPEILREFDRLNKSSSRFPDKLARLLFKKEYEYRISELQDEDVSWLAEYLDNVCLRIALYLLSAQPA